MGDLLLPFFLGGRLGVRLLTMVIASDLGGEGVVERMRFEDDRRGMVSCGYGRKPKSDNF